MFWHTLLSCSSCFFLVPVLLPGQTLGWVELKERKTDLAYCACWPVLALKSAYQVGNEVGSRPLN